MSTHVHAATEEDHLEEVIGEIDRQRRAMSQIVERADEGTASLRAYFWESIADMDGAEKNAIRGIVNTDTATQENSQRILDNLDRARLSPYFARIDFRRDSRTEVDPCYIGIRGLRKRGDAIIHDWRAPISGMFYEYEQGAAAFSSPDGVVNGELLLKRQFIIRDSSLEAVLDTNVSIDDDILKRELSTRPDEKMKNIVTTIQREQNAIIRNENAEVLIIQGVAGSGKTSIALHRVAYMLYRFQTTISAQDMMILSPNQVFGDYIANVLPELGEETIPEMEFERLAVNILGPKVRFQPLHEQIEALLTRPDEALRHRIRQKSSVEFYEELRHFLEGLDQTHFVPRDVSVSILTVTAAEMGERMRFFSTSSAMTMKEKMAKLASSVLGTLKHRAISEQIPWQSAWSTHVTSSIKKMFPFASAAAAYRSFYAERGTPELLHMLPRNTYEYSDLFPMAYAALHIEKRIQPSSAKHVLVDEMQDYSPLHYAVLAHLYPCRLTILGDAYQAVNPDGSSSMKSIASVFPQAEQITLGRSYRSTIEIAGFAQQVSPNPDLIPFERHGEPPTVTTVDGPAAQLARVRGLLEGSLRGGCTSIGIICRTGEEAAALHRELGPAAVQLIDYASLGFTEGPLVTTVHMAKGLEFEHVILADASDVEYGTEMGKNLLYVACTRATNRLDIVCVGKPARWIPLTPGITGLH